MPKPFYELPDEALERMLDSLAEIYKGYQAELDRRREQRAFEVETERRRRGQQRPVLRLVTA
jgi:hypothetical protein